MAQAILAIVVVKYSPTNITATATLNTRAVLIMETGNSPVRCVTALLRSVTGYVFIFFTCTRNTVLISAQNAGRASPSRPAWTNTHECTVERGPTNVRTVSSPSRLRPFYALTYVSTAARSHLSANIAGGRSRRTRRMTVTCVAIITRIVFVALKTRHWLGFRAFHDLAQETGELFVDNLRAFINFHILETKAIIKLNSRNW